METKFTPEQLKNSPEFADFQDVISVVLDPNELYTKNELRRALNAYSQIIDREVH